ncbi:MAG: rRNA pseudouridine synthase, partial [Caldisericia bacterium]|nr:rRNA pseudouridine synthase [Caldisericia bacterium]
MNRNDIENKRIKLHTYVTESGIGSRRKSEELIRSGHIYVNGDIITKPEERIVPQNDVVTYNDKILKPYTQVHYILLNKPTKVMTTLNDPQKRKTVMYFVPKELPIFPVGRLDYDSEGIIILTNDGELSKKILSPNHHVPKTYLVRVQRMPDLKTIIKLRKGIYMDGYRTKPA